MCVSVCAFPHTVCVVAMLCARVCGHVCGFSDGNHNNRGSRGWWVWYRSGQISFGEREAFNLSYLPCLLHLCTTACYDPVYIITHKWTAKNLLLFLECGLQIKNTPDFFLFSLDNLTTVTAIAFSFVYRCMNACLHACCLLSGFLNANEHSTNRTGFLLVCVCVCMYVCVLLLVSLSVCVVVRGRVRMCTCVCSVHACARET